MRLIDADALCRNLSDWQYGDFAKIGHETEYGIIDKVLAGVSAAPTIDAVPWEFLERYADYFCAEVSMPEFVREAKQFYADTNQRRRKPIDELPKLRGENG